MMARKPKAKGASKEAPGLLSTFLAEVEPPGLLFPTPRVPGTIPMPRMPKTIPILPLDQMIDQMMILSQLETIARVAPEAVAALDIILPSIMARRASAANKVEATRHFAVVVEVVEQYCKTSRVRTSCQQRPR